MPLISQLCWYCSPITLSFEKQKKTKSFQDIKRVVDAKAAGTQPRGIQEFSKLREPLRNQLVAIARNDGEADFAIFQALSGDPLRDIIPLTPQKPKPVSSTAR